MVFDHSLYAFFKTQQMQFKICTFRCASMFHQKWKLYANVDVHTEYLRETVPTVLLLNMSKNKMD